MLVYFILKRTSLDYNGDDFGISNPKNFLSSGRLFLDWFLRTFRSFVLAFQLRVFAAPQVEFSAEQSPFHRSPQFFDQKRRKYRHRQVRLQAIFPITKVDNPSLKTSYTTFDRKIELFWPNQNFDLKPRILLDILRVLIIEECQQRWREVWRNPLEYL